VLLELIVENYAVVENLRVRFGPGLNVLTGETGSGKSIVVDALGLLFGSRASADALRSGADRARISAIFEIPKRSVELLAKAGIEVEDEEIIVEREVLANGKSRAFIANRPVTAALLRDLAHGLGDIHGQHDQQRLFSSDAQLEIVDSFAGTEALLAEIGSVYKELRSCSLELEEIARTEGEKLRLLDLWTFQRNEIEGARLSAGEDAALEAERRVLQNVTRLLENANVAYAALYDAPESAYAQLRLAGKKIEDLCRIDESLAGVFEAIRSAHIAVDEAAGTLRDYLGSIEADPQRLEDVEARLAAIDKLKRKYGHTVDEILAFFANVDAQINAAESSTERRSQIERKKAELSARFDALAAELSSQRRTAAAAMSKRIQSELKSLAMERTVFEVRVEPTPPSSTGTDTITFFASPNLGEEPRPLDKIASGGELSRVALALKTVVTGGAKGRTLVFDEVDAGIGGAAAERVGKRLKTLSARNQVLCVTHLAQIAGFADHHYAVEKRESNGRTVAELTELHGEARVREIGRMFAGQRLTPEALKHAEQMIRLGSSS
jgi:DNA repair protein RecN (Recombination protein N)